MELIKYFNHGIDVDDYINVYSETKLADKKITTKYITNIRYISKALLFGLLRENYRSHLALYDSIKGLSFDNIKKDLYFRFYFGCEICCRETRLYVLCN